MAGVPGSLDHGGWWQRFEKRNANQRLRKGPSVKHRSAGAEFKSVPFTIQFFKVCLLSRVISTSLNLLLSDEWNASKRCHRLSTKATASHSGCFVCFLVSFFPPLVLFLCFAVLIQIYGNIIEWDSADRMRTCTPEHSKSRFRVISYYIKAIAQWKIIWEYK